MPSAMNRAPTLDRTSNSWVITTAAGGVIETWSRRTADAFAANGARVETAAQYLGRINREIEEVKTP